MLLSLPAALPAQAQDFDLSWHTIDGGGEMFSTGGGFELGGTIGQPDANEVVLTGGEFELIGGFWAVAECDPCDMNCDGVVDALDIEPFLDLLFGGGTPCDFCTGDVNGDMRIDAGDIQGFIECLFP
ncbi:MAG: hypothetical protein O7F76_14275 [Planctomycetota bacterium]|nr:hypothetical protein [Planctomycetota bacterium]